MVEKSAHAILNHRRHSRGRLGSKWGRGDLCTVGVVATATACVSRARAPSLPPSSSRPAKSGWLLISRGLRPAAHCRSSSPPAHPRVEWILEEAPPLVAALLPISRPCVLSPLACCWLAAGSVLLQIIPA
ncbi:hypothetical protein DAI22_07g159500 [Oryza sativa Japonica Group]|nr:hypothetical protein DAI22_07g159500 [Oryza sativa Japonica Group]